MTDRRYAIVRASAGSGKTYRLTSRYLALLRLGADPATILATTFTRKAAGEIRARILMRLAKAADDDEARQTLDRDLNKEELADLEPMSAEDARRMLHQLVGRLDRLQIGTLDAWFHRLAGLFQDELALPEGASPANPDSPTMDRLARQAVLQALDASAEQGKLPDMRLLLAAMHHGHARRSVTPELVDLLRMLEPTVREAPEPKAWSAWAPDPPQLDEAQLQSLQDRLLKAQHALPRNKKDKPNGHWVKAYRPLPGLLAARDWRGLISHTFVSQALTGQVVYHSIAAERILLDVLVELAHEAKAHVLQQTREAHLARYSLAKQLAAHWQRTLDVERLMRYEDVTTALAQLLPGLDDPTLADVFYRLDGRIEHLLIDEFQDTSLDQWRVLAPIVRETVGDSTTNRTLFIVGDPKQSIYGWRGGRHELFSHVEQTLDPMHPRIDTTSKNYRSSPVVLDAVNRCFGALQEGASDWTERYPQALNDFADAFEPHTAVHKQHSGYVELSVSPAEVSDKTEYSSPDDSDPDAEDALHEDSPHLRHVADRMAELYHIAPHRSLAALTRKRKPQETLIRLLRERGVPAQGQSGATLNDSPAVLAVLAALRWAGNPDDPVTRFHVAHSPMGLLLNLTATTRTREANRLARGLRLALLDQGPAALLGQWIPPLIASCHAAEAQRLEQLQVAVESDPDLPADDPAALAEALGAMPVGADDEAGVRVMTIHGSKGLEFDTVFLPDLDGPIKPPKTHLPLPVAQGLLDPPSMVLPTPPKDVRALDPALQDAFDAADLRVRYEVLCMLYVAMTRARRQLNLIIQPRPLTKKERQAIRNGGALNDCEGGSRIDSVARLLVSCLAGEAEDPVNGGTALWKQGDPQWMQAKGSQDAPERVTPIQAPPVRLTLPAGSGRTPVQRSPSSLAEHHTEPSPPGENTLTPSNARAPITFQPSTPGMDFGSAVHACFECVGFIDDPGGVPEDDAWRETLQAMGAGAMADAVIRACRQALDKPAVQHALQRVGAEELWQERRFIIPDGEQALAGVFDRVTLYPTGSICRARILDYKTDRIEHKADLDQAVARYRPQLTAYRRALGQLIQTDQQAIETALLFTGTGQVVLVHGQANED